MDANRTTDKERARTAKGMKRDRAEQARSQFCICPCHYGALQEGEACAMCSEPGRCKGVAK